jgi:hypothetical protein
LLLKLIFSAVDIESILFFERSLSVEDEQIYFFLNLPVVYGLIVVRLLVDLEVVLLLPEREAGLMAGVLKVLLESIGFCIEALLVSWVLILCDADAFKRIPCEGGGSRVEHILLAEILIHTLVDLLLALVGLLLELGLSKSVSTFTSCRKIFKHSLCFFTSSL